MQWVENSVPVYSREFGKQRKWRQGVIGAQTGPVSYTVLLHNDHEVHRHQDHVIRRETPEEQRVSGSSRSRRTTRPTPSGR